jgi:NifU-like protein
VSYYPDRIREHFLAPRNTGEVADSDAVAERGSFICGAVLRLSLKLEAETRRIAEAKFKAAGCGYLIAAASVVTEIIRGLTAAEAAQAAGLLPETLTEYFGQTPADKEHCARLCADALREAVADYSRRVRDEWAGEEALVCTCFGVSEKRIEQVITENHLRTVREVTKACNAGGGCHSCHPLIEEMLEVHWRTPDFDFTAGADES